MGNKKVRWIVGAVVLAAAVGGGYYFREDIKEYIPFLQEGNADDKVYVEKVSKLMEQYTGITNRYNGVVETQDSYEVNVDSSREVAEVLVKVGDLVEEGQPLVRYDTSDMDLQIKQAELDLEGIQNELDSQRNELENLATEAILSGMDQFAYESERLSMENNIKQTQLDYDSKKLEVDKLKEQNTDNTLLSKKSGIVKEINEFGMDNYGNSAAFMTIMQTGNYRVKGSIDEQNVWMIADGQKVIIRSRVDENQTWTGTISKVDTDNIEKDDEENYYSESETISATKYPFYVQLESVDGLLLGQHVYIELDEGQEKTKEGLWIYASYVVEDETGTYVWAANDKDRLEKRYVELGQFDEELGEYEILSGLTKKDYVTWPMPGLYEGVVTVTNESEVDYSSPLYNQDSTEEMSPFEGSDLYSVDMEDTELYYDMDMEDTELYYDMDMEDTELLSDRQDMRRNFMEAME